MEGSLNCSRKRRWQAAYNPLTNRLLPASVRLKGNAPVKLLRGFLGELDSSRARARRWAGGATASVVVGPWKPAGHLHGCGPDRFISRSARNTLLCRFAIHCRPLDVTLR